MEEPTSLALVYLHTGTMNPATGAPLPDEERKKPISIKEYVEAHAQRGANGKPDPRAVANGMEYWRNIEDEIERINRSNTSHAWQVFRVDPETGRERVQPVNTCLRQIHVGDFFRAVRLYCFGKFSGQNLTKAERRGLLIDGEPVAELDFSGMATRMLYHHARLDPEGDIYKPELIMPKFYALANASPARRAVVRDMVKRATNICWNVNSRPKANSALGRMLVEHPEAEFLRKLLANTEGIVPAQVIDRVIEAHPALAHRFFTEFGVELMTTDGKIMLHILGRFADADKPVLGIHDAVVCRASDAAFAEETMAAVYRSFILFDPKITRVF